MKTKLHAKVRPNTPEAPQVKPKKQKGTFSRVMKALFRYYPGMTTLTIIFLVINAIVSSVPAIFMENIYSMDLVATGQKILLLYLIVLAGYMAVTWVIYLIRYAQTRKRLSLFLEYLNDLDEKEEEEGL